MITYPNPPGSEQGMCGKFNEIIANFAIKNIDELKVIGRTGQ
ncbi:MAG: hypothetical protein WA144_06135 [Candidatus Methanoperedens sp.]